ncbi:MAG: M48 family metallopeptidase [Opitutales bacterium]
MSPILIAFLVLLVLKTLVSLYLDFLNLKHVQAHASERPEALKSVVDAETYEKTVRYTLAKGKFGVFNGLFDAVALGIIVATGFLGGSFVWLTEAWGAGIWAQAAILFLIPTVLGLLDLPFDYYSQFKIEAEFGFNKSTVGLWVADQFRNLAVGALLMIPLVALLLFIVQSLPNTWWLWGFILLFGFQLVMIVVYPKFIIPLYNKLSPLPEGELKERLLALAEKLDFPTKTIEVIDGSKRSGHSNAYFTGFGKFRQVVIYDTLIEQLEPEQLEAVLAHEIGHYKKGHIPKTLITFGVVGLAAFAFIGWLTQVPAFIEGLGFVGVPEGAVVPATLMAFSIMSGLITFWMSPLSARRSRKHEYEADAYAKDAVGGAEPMIGALRNLFQKNLSNLNPHPIYSGFYYSHPTLLEREAALRAE